MSRFIRASILATLEKLDLAKEEATRCLTYRSANLPKNHPLLAEAHNLMARIAVRRGEFESSIEHTKAAIAIQKVVFPQGGRPLGSNLMNLGFLYMEMGDLELAENTVRSAAAALEAQTGMDPADTAACYITLSDIYHMQKKDSFALESISKAIELFRARPGAMPLNLAHALYRKGCMVPVSNSEALFRESWNLFSKLGSNTSPDALAAARRVSAALMSKGNFIASRELLEKLRASFEKAGDIPFHERLATHVNLGITYDKLEIFDKAEESLLTGYRLCQGSDQTQRERLVTLRRTIHEFYRRMGNKEKAAAFAP